MSDTRTIDEIETEELYIEKLKRENAELLRRLQEALQMNEKLLETLRKLDAGLDSFKQRMDAHWEKRPDFLKGKG